MIQEEILQLLTERQDTAYRDFQSPLMPTVDKNTVIGVRTPVLKQLAKELLPRKDIGIFLASLPHTTFDENQLHAYILSEMKETAECIEEIDRFLPYIDNWATCDSLSPKIFRKHPPELLPAIDRWLADSHTYTVRFAVSMLMRHYLDNTFSVSYVEKVCAVQSEAYDVNMMIAWYFATALAKQYEAVLPFMEQYRLSPWTHNKAIQKALESRRITPEQKAYLKQLKVKSISGNADGGRGINLPAEPLSD